MSTQTTIKFAYSGSTPFIQATSDTGVPRIRLGNVKSRLGQNVVLGMYVKPGSYLLETYQAAISPVNSSLNFTISSVVSRGGYGENGALYFKSIAPGSGNNGNLFYRFTVTDTDVWTKSTYIFQSGATNTNTQSQTAIENYTASISPITSSLNFTISSVVSRAGYGENGALFFKAMATTPSDGRALIKYGTVKGLASVVHNISATLAGVGTCSATANRIGNATATLNGVGSITATALPILYITATLNGASSITASLTDTHATASTLSGSSTCTATASITHSRSATLAGTGSITASAIRFNDADGFYETGATISGGGGNIILVQRFSDNQYLDGTNDWPLVAPMIDRRETPSLLGYDYGYLANWLDNDLRYRYPGDDQIFEEIIIWDIVTSWPTISSFSGTVSGKTFQQSTMSTFTIKNTNIILHKPSVTATTGFECDGKTNVAFNTTAEYEGFLNIGTHTAVSIKGDKVYQGRPEMDGHTNCAFGSSLYATSGFECDGKTNVAFSADVNYNINFRMEGSTDCEFTGNGEFAGLFNMSGETAMSTDYRWTGAGLFDCNGHSAMAITAAQYYAAFFAWTGHTAMQITAHQVYAAFIFLDGIASCNFTNTQRIRYVDINMNGHTSCTFESADQILGFIHMDGHTNWNINTSLLPFVEIVCTGVGDLFINAQKGVFQGFSALGHTNVAIGANAHFGGLLQWYTGIGGDMRITPHREITIGFSCLGETTFTIETATDQYGSVIFLPDSELISIGSYVYDDTTSATSTSVLSLTSKEIVLGPNYLFGTIYNSTDFGSPDFAPIFSSYFTTSGIKSTSQGGPNFLGIMKQSFAFGFNRQMETIIEQPLYDNTRLEWIRIPLFVSDVIDNTQISNTVGFSLSGISAIGGDGILGTEQDEYVTFSVLTHALLTQEVMEILATGNPPVRITAINYEMLWIPASYCRNTQTVEEVLYLANLAAVEQEATECLAGGNGGEALIDQVALEMIYSIKAYVLMTMATLEALQGPGNPGVLNTLTTMEVLTLNQIVFFCTAYIQQVAIAAVGNANPHALVEAVAVEQIFGGSSKGLVESVAIEGLGNGNSNADIQQVALAELNNSTTTPVGVDQIAVEFLVKPEFDGTVGALINNPHYHFG